jgi:capsular polysaccharide biosynthesis protein
MHSNGLIGLMDSEIDLRVYLRILRRGWLVIVVCALVFAVAAFALTRFVLPRAYTAEALIYLFPPSYEFDLDAQFLPALPDEAALRNLTRLALSDAVIAQMIEELRPQIHPDRATDLQIEPLQEGILNASLIDDNVLNLSATWTNAEEAALIAGVWAQKFINAANDVIGYEDDARSADLAAQQGRAESTYAAAREALVAHQALNPVAPLERQRSVLRDQYEGVLRQLDRIDLLLIDMQTLRTAFGALPAGARPSAGDVLALINAQTRSSTLAGAAAPILQVDEALTADQTYAALLEQLAAYENAVLAQQTALTERLAPTLTALQAAESAFQNARNQEQRLQTDVDRTLAALQTLISARETLEVYASTIGSIARVGAAPVIPGEPSQPRVLTTTLIAAVVGLAVGLLLVFISAYLRADPLPSGTGAPATTASIAANQRP